MVFLDYPGRGGLSSEPLLTDLDQIVDGIFAKIHIDLNDNYAFYGHSMGGMVAFLTIHKIQQNQLPMPRHLFVSGNRGPKNPRRKLEFLHRASSVNFTEGLRSIGGCPEEILNNPEAMAYFEPILRSDFRALETYCYQQTLKLQIPITCMVGKEEDITEEEAWSWSEETTGHVEVIEFPGDHFFIFDASPKILALIRERNANEWMN